MFKYFCSYYKDHKKLFALDIFCVFLMAGIDLIFPLVTRKVLQGEITSTKVILWIGAILLIFYLLRFGLSFIIGYYGHYLGIKIETDMRKDLFKKFETLDYQYFETKKSGELLTNLTTHLHDLSEMSHHVPEDLFVSIIMIVGSFIILMFINPILTAIVFVSIIVLIFFTILRRKKLMASFRLVRKEQGELASRIGSSLSGISLTKAYNNEEYEIKNFDSINMQYQNSRKKSFKELGLFGSTVNLLTNITNLVLLIVGSIMVIHSEQTHFYLQDLVAFFLYINFLISPITKLSSTMEMLQQGWSGFERFYSIMMLQPTIVSKKDSIKNHIFKGKIEFKDVSFHYGEDQEDILHHFSLTIQPGEKIALVGETGVGKTTISKLIPRFYDVMSGEINIDDHDIRDYELYDLRNAIGHVQQDVFIFWGTIKENILYGRPDASDEEVIEATKKANIHDFIMSLPDQYDTLTGERGVRLSGGQKQRISIARLFLKQPAIIILDEATSSLDNVTEKMIQEAFKDLSKGKTAIIIAHRLSTIKNCNRIIVLGKNGILEAGTHESLLAKKGVYAQMYHASMDE